MKSKNTSLAEAMFTVSRYMKDTMSFNKNLIHLTVLQLQALAFLKRNEDAQMSEIASQFRIELPSATSLVNTLVKAGLVTRKQDKKDRRLVRIALSKQGTSLLEQASTERSKKVSEILTFLSEKDAADLLRIMENLAGKLTKQYEK
ncbi:MAG: MarR family winged helix-turn-helix transcriptional regulator [Candidatus Levyibacteriota bacterium]